MLQLTVFFSIAVLVVAFFASVLIVAVEALAYFERVEQGCMEVG